MPLSISGSGTLNGLSLPTDSLKPALVHLRTENFNSSSLVAIDNIFSSVYDNYKIIIQLESIVSTNSVHFRYRSGGSEDSSSNYYYNSHLQQDSSQTIFTYSRSAGLQTYIRVSEAAATGGPSSILIDIFSPYRNTRTTSVGQSSAKGTTDMTRMAFGTMTNSTTQYDGFSLYPANGADGTIRVYGYRNDA